MFVRYLWGARRLWRTPRQSRILIYDASHEELLRSYLAEWAPEVLHVRGEQINVPVLFSSIFRKGRKFEAYIDNFIEAVRPSLVVTMIDNNPDFLALSKRHPAVETLFVQNGVRAYVGDIFETLDTTGQSYRRSLFVDHMLVFGSTVGAEYARFVDGRVVLMGSIKNNHVERVTSPRVGVIAFISQWRNYGPVLGGQQYSHDQFFQPDEVILPFLEGYAREHEKQIMIVPVNSRGSELRNAEEKYFAALLGCTPQFVERPEPFGSYHAIDSAEVVVGVDSTLAYESAARGNKTAILSIRGTLLGLPSYNFGWPGQLAAEGPFWTNHPDTKVFRRILDGLFAADDATWRAALVAERFSDLMRFDPSNTILRTVIRERLNAPHCSVDAPSNTGSSA